MVYRKHRQMVIQVMVVDHCLNFKTSGSCSNLKGTKDKLSVERLSNMKKYVSGLGSAQVTEICWLFHLCKLALCKVSIITYLNPIKAKFFKNSQPNAPVPTTKDQDLAVVVLLILIPLISPNSSKGGKSIVMVDTHVSDYQRMIDSLKTEVTQLNTQLAGKESQLNTKPIERPVDDELSWLNILSQETSENVQERINLQKKRCSFGIYRCKKLSRDKVIRVYDNQIMIDEALGDSQMAGKIGSLKVFVAQITGDADDCFYNYGALSRFLSLTAVFFSHETSNWFMNLSNRYLNNLPYIKQLAADMPRKTQPTPTTLHKNGCVCSVSRGADTQQLLLLALCIKIVGLHFQSDKARLKSKNSLAVVIKCAGGTSEPKGNGFA
ncbi:P-loop containing nucleoside triphosphate hydrolases superfamily protein [Artemisia annua]|uniref:P-loop containing nucleoside triphosphate hydrolases superfamily protein n=1 Tax=Artemisia annua TaxID=35608 RepID=A0A2U1NL53_ARTAN|nr:P-loop containing nucleoside triphosphate hydrolases superfamily protein [Artemisia annua]